MHTKHIILQQQDSYTLLIVVLVFTIRAWSFWYRIPHHYLTTIASLEPKRSSKQPPFYTTTANSPVRCAFWVYEKCGASAPHCSFYLPQVAISNLAIFSTLPFFLCSSKLQLFINLFCSRLKTSMIVQPIILCSVSLYI